MFNNVIPTMTSNTTPSGIASTDSTRGSTYAAWKAFDKQNNTYWQASSTYPHWLQYQFPTGKTITAYGFINSRVDSYPVSWTFLGSNDGNNWTILDTQENRSWIGSGYDLQFFEIVNTISYAYYRINITYTLPRNGTWPRIDEFYMFETAGINNITLGNLYQENKVDDGLTLKLPFSDDNNEDCVVNAYYKLSADEEYTLFGEFTRGEVMFTSIITGLLPGGEYDFKSVAVDADGITGEATQYVLNQTLTYNQIKISNIKPTKTYNSITITADIEGDDNSDSSIQYRYRRAAVGNFEAGAWSEYIPITVNEGQINFTITGLIKSTNYDIDINISDADGVNDATT